MAGLLITRTLTPIQVCAAMKLAGWPASEWATGAAVTQGESSDIADNVNTSSGAYGLFQILKSAHPDLFAKLPYPDAWADPIINAWMGPQVWQGRGSKWDTGGWQAFGGAQYQAALPAAQAASAQLQQNLASAGSSDAQNTMLRNLMLPVSPVLQGFTNAGTNVLDLIGSGAAQAGQFAVASGAAVNSAVTSTPLDWLSTIGQFFSRLGQANTWLRIGEFLLGAALIVAGTAHLMTNTPVGRAAKSVATKAAIL